MKKTHRLLIFLLGLTVTPVFAQTTLFKVANENDSVTSATAITYDFGALSGTTTSSPSLICSATTRNCMAPAVTTTIAVTNLSVTNGAVAKTDPAVGLPKSLYVVATNVVQIGTVKSSATGAVTSWSVPALTVAAPPATTIPSLTLTITGPTITTPITLKLGGTLGWCTFISSNDSTNYGIAVTGCLQPPPAK
jgi:hypothetical protein